MVHWVTAEISDRWDGSMQGGGRDGCTGKPQGGESSCLCHEVACGGVPEEEDLPAGEFMLLQSLEGVSKY